MSKLILVISRTEGKLKYVLELSENLDACVMKHVNHLIFSHHVSEWKGESWAYQWLVRPVYFKEISHFYIYLYSSIYDKHSDRMYNLVPGVENSDCKRVRVVCKGIIIRLFKI